MKKSLKELEKRICAGMDTILERKMMSDISEHIADEVGAGVEAIEKIKGGVGEDEYTVLLQICKKSIKYIYKEKMTFKKEVKENGELDKFIVSIGGVKIMSMSMSKSERTEK